MKGLEEMPGTLEHALRRERKAERKRLKRAEAEKLRQAKREAREAKRRTKKAFKEKIIDPAGPDMGCSLIRTGGPHTGKPTTKPRLDEIEQYQH